MKRPVLISFIIALSLLGLADAWYLAETALTKTALTCSIGGLDGCNIVAQSPYSHVRGVPLGVYGAAFYGLFLLLAIGISWRQWVWLDRLLLVFGGIGFLASLYFLYVQIVLIQALCIYCLASAGIAFALLGAALQLVFPRPASS
jgi:uncharacterized membrane protein